MSQAHEPAAEGEVHAEEPEAAELRLTECYILRSEHRKLPSHAPDIKRRQEGRVWKELCFSKVWRAVVQTVAERVKCGILQ